MLSKLIYYSKYFELNPTQHLNGMNFSLSKRCAVQRFKPSGTCQAFGIKVSFTDHNETENESITRKGHAYAAFSFLNDFQRSVRREHRCQRTSRYGWTIPKCFLISHFTIDFTLPTHRAMPTTSAADALRASTDLQHVRMDEWRFSLPRVTADDNRCERQRHTCDILQSITKLSCQSCWSWFGIVLGELTNGGVFCSVSGTYLFPTHARPDCPASHGG